MTAENVGIIYVHHVFSFVPGSLAAIGLVIVSLSQASQTICKQKD